MKYKTIKDINMKKILGAVVVAALCVSSVSAEVAKKESILKLMEKTGAKNMGKQMMARMMPSMKVYAPKAPDSFWDDMVKEIDMDKLVELIVPIYQKHFTEEDIQDINNFYDTPVGQKMIEHMPQIMQESMNAGQEWGKEIGEMILKKLKEKKYLAE